MPPCACRNCEHRRHRRHAADPVLELGRMPHELAPAVPRDVDRVVRTHAGREQRLDDGRIEHRRIEQRFAEGAAVGEPCSIALGQPLGELARQADAVRVDAARGEQHDRVAGLQALAEHQPICGPSRCRRTMPRGRCAPPRRRRRAPASRRRPTPCRRRRTPLASRARDPACAACRRTMRCCRRTSTRAWTTAWRRR